MRYTPDAPPRGATPDQLAEYLHRELWRISQTVDHPEATHINYGKEVQNIASGVPLTIQWNRGQKQRVELRGDADMTWAPPDGACNIMLRLIQDDIGGWTPTIPCNVHWQAGTLPTWTTTANAVDVISCYFDGTNFHCTALLNSKTHCEAPPAP
jgi:hypothetical protein